MTMTRHFILRCAVLLALAVAGGSCTRQPQAPVGLPDFESALRAADDAVLHDDGRSVRRAMDLTGVPPAIARLLNESDGSFPVAPDYRYTERKVLTAEEHRAFEAKFSERLPAYFRERPFPEKWNITPDRWIVYIFDPVKPEPNRSPLRVTVGAFQKSGLWFFAVDYYPYETAP